MLGYILLLGVLKAALALPDGFIAEARCDFPVYHEMDVELAKSSPTPILFKNVAPALLGYDKVAFEQEAFDQTIQPLMHGAPLLSRQTQDTIERIVDPNKELWSVIQQQLKYSDTLLSFFNPNYTRPLISSGLEGYYRVMHSHERTYAFRFVGKLLWSLAPPEHGAYPEGSIKNLHGCFEGPAHSASQVCVQEEGDLVVIPDQWMHGTCHLAPFNSGLSFSVLDYDFPAAARKAAVAHAKRAEKRKRKKEEKARQAAARAKAKENRMTESL